MHIRPDQVINEILDFNSKVTQGMETLTNLGEIKIGACAKEAVYQEGKMTLYRYTPMVEDPFPVPLLITYALVNRPYMADLRDGRSIIQGLLRAGMDVYLIDWGYPDEEDASLTLDDYINGYMRRCVEFICREQGVQSLNMMGICQGGTFSACYAALRPERVRNLITTVTPIDFHAGENLLAHLVKHIDVDLAVDTMGNIPGEVLNVAFLNMRPYRLLGQKYVDMVNFLDSPEKMRDFLSMEKWIFDSPDQAGEAYRQFIKDLYQRNLLVKGGFQLAGQTVNLEQVTMPVLNIYASKDHLVPPESSRALADCVGTEDYSELEFPGGHIGIYVSGKAQKVIPRAIADWLRVRFN